MTSKLLLDMSKLFQKCPKCKSEKLDGESGSLEISSSVIKRTCACGYELTINISEIQK